MPDDTIVPDDVLYAMKHYTLVYLSQALYNMICQLSKMKDTTFVPNGVFNVMRHETLSDGKATQWSD